MSGLLVGTRKGLFVLDSDDRRSWRASEPRFAGWEVFDVAGDTRDGTSWAAVSSWVHGPVVARSSDGGSSWEHSGEGITYGDGGPEITRVWTVEPGNPSRPGEVYAGVEPAGLFRSTDGGETWSHVSALRELPSLPDWQPGGGGLCLHQVLVDPDDPDHLWVAISAVGVFESRDGGASWETRNRGVPTVYGDSEGIDRCPHHLSPAAGQPDVLYRQDHVGRFRSEDGGAQWQPIEDPDGVSGFGFGVVSHPRDPDTAWFLPLIAPERRYVPDGRPAVARTRDGGKSFEQLPLGPDGAYLVFLRAAFCGDREESPGLYAGSTTGQVYASADEGDSWTLAADLLPPVLAVAALP